MMRLKQYKLLFISLLLCMASQAQTAGYNYKANLDPVPESGFYNIELTPNVNAHLKVDCSDLRIVNDSGKWLPHLLRSPNGRFSTKVIEKSLNIIKKESSTERTDLVVETIDSSTSTLILEIKNTIAKRYASVTGSDDLVNWFIINDSIVIEPQKVNGENNSYFWISFPPVNYKYLRVNINNHGKDPFNIVTIRNKARIPDLSSLKGLKYHPRVENPLPRIIQKDSAGKSYVKIILPAYYHFENISLKVSGAKYYERLIEVYQPATVENSFSNPGQWVDSFTVSNNSTLEFKLLNPLKTKEFYLIIHNEDNPPLKVEEVKTFLEYKVATAWLEKAKHYSILMDNPLAIQPNYDLKEENLYSEKEFPVIKNDSIVSLRQAPIVTAVTKNKTMIWLLIAAAVIVLAFFTWKLITDMNKSKA